MTDWFPPPLAQPFNIEPTKHSRPGCNCNASLVCLCFDLYDTDHNGQIAPDEFDFMIQDVFGQRWEENDEAKAAHSW